MVGLSLSPYLDVAEEIFLLLTEPISGWRKQNIRLKRILDRVNRFLVDATKTFGRFVSFGQSEVRSVSKKICFDPNFFARSEIVQSTETIV